MTSRHGSQVTSHTSQSHVTRHWHESTERKQHPIRRALYLDTEGTFRPDRLEPIAARYELDLDFVLENVIHARFLNWCVRRVLGLSTWCPAGRAPYPNCARGSEDLAGSLDYGSLACGSLALANSFWTSGASPHTPRCF